MNKRIQRMMAAVLPVIWLWTGVAAAQAAPVELTLKDSIVLAMKNNYNVKYAKSSREKSYWALQESKKNKGVSISFNHVDEHYSSPPSSSSMYKSSSDSDFFENTISLTVPVYSGGKLENQIEQAKLDLQVADLEIRATIQQVSQTVISDYFSILEYQNEVAVDQDTVNNYKEHLQLVQDKFDLGMVAKTDVLSSQVDLAKAQDTLIVAQNNLNNAIAALNSAIGLPHGAELVLKDDFKHEKYPLSLEECLQHAERHRPELAQYKAKIASAEYGVKVAQSNYLPQVSLTAEQDWYDTHFAGTQNSNWLVKMTTSLNVFDSGLTEAKVEQAKKNVSMVQDQSDQERDSILLEVRQYHLSMTEAEKRIDTNKTSVDQAEENLRIQKVRYEVGVGTNLDLVDAILSLATAQKDQIKALYDFHTNKAQLERSIGWNDATAAAAKKVSVKTAPSATGGPGATGASPVK